MPPPQYKLGDILTKAQKRMYYSNNKQEVPKNIIKIEFNKNKNMIFFV